MARGACRRVVRVHGAQVHRMLVMRDPPRSDVKEVPEILDPFPKGLKRQGVREIAEMMA